MTVRIPNLLVCIYSGSKKYLQPRGSSAHPLFPHLLLICPTSVLPLSHIYSTLTTSLGGKVSSGHPTKDITERVGAAST